MGISIQYWYNSENKNIKLYILKESILNLQKIINTIVLPPWQTARNMFPWKEIVLNIKFYDLT